MAFLIVGLVAFISAGLTLIAGFGLGTLLLPAFALVFPVALAVAATAVVHVANNVFKLVLLRGDADGRIVFRFGLPAVASAFGGAFLLGALAGLEPIASWKLGRLHGVIEPITLVMGLLILGFSAFDLVPALGRVRVGEAWLPVGGLLSGFFGGLSGHQGALRAAFLGRLDLSPVRFAATQAAVACLVDVSRISVYGSIFFHHDVRQVGARNEWPLVVFAIACAFAGSFVGRRLLPSVRIKTVHYLTGALLLATGLLLGAGVV